MSKKVRLPFALLTASCAIQAAVGIYKFISGMDGNIEMCSALLGMIYASMLRTIPDEKVKVFHFLPSVILFYISLAELAWYSFGFGDTAGIIIFIPIVIGGAYCLWKTIGQYREIFGQYREIFSRKNNDKEN